MHSKNFYPWAGFVGAIAALLLIAESPNASSKPPEKISENTDVTPAPPERRDLSVAVRSAPPTAVAIDYFMEVAIGAEWGDAGQQIRRWHQAELTVAVRGNPTSTDWQVLRQVSSELERWTGLRFEFVSDRNFGKSAADIEIYFAPEHEFPRLLPSYQPGNKGFFWVWWTEQGIQHAKILIDSQGIGEQARAHLIREELTQSLGLMRDSWRQADSIFYQGWTTTSSYAAIDTSVIEMLYRSDIRSGMTAEEARRILTES